jgi:hypothetical protein
MLKVWSKWRPVSLFTPHALQGSVWACLYVCLFRIRKILCIVFVRMIFGCHLKVCIWFWTPFWNNARDGHFVKLIFGMSYEKHALKRHLHFWFTESDLIQNCETLYRHKNANSLVTTVLFQELGLPPEFVWIWNGPFSFGSPFVMMALVAAGTLN